MLTKDVIRFFDESYALDPDDRRAYPILGPIAGTPPTVLATAAPRSAARSGRHYAAALVEGRLRRDLSWNSPGISTVSSRSGKRSLARRATCLLFWAR